MAQEILKSWHGIISNTRRILNAMFTELYSRLSFPSLKIGSSTDYSEFSNIGILIMKGNARIKRHFYVWAGKFKKPAANFPDDGWEGMHHTLDFDKTTEQSVYYTMNIPYRQDILIDMEIHVLWLHDTNQANANIFARFGFEYRSVSESEAVAGASTTITQDSAGHNTDQGLLIDTCFTNKILAMNLATHDQLGIRFYRDVADDFAEDIRLIGIHIIFTMNKLGQQL